MKQPFLQAIAERVLVLDGAMGTMLQARGLRPGQSPEELNLTLPEVVAGVHREYLDAGADIIVTNTFGGSRAKLEHYGLQDRVAEINARAVAIAREVCGDRAYVAASIGPTGQFVEPVGDVSFDEMAAIFREQARALVDAGRIRSPWKPSSTSRKSVRRSSPFARFRRISPSLPSLPLTTRGGPCSAPRPRPPQ